MEERRFKVGDLVMGRAGSSRKYAITNEDMTLGEVVSVGVGGITVKVLEHRSGCHAGGLFYDLDAGCFELVSPVGTADFEVATGDELQAFVKGE